MDKDKQSSIDNVTEEGWIPNWAGWPPAELPDDEPQIGKPSSDIYESGDDNINGK